MSTTRKKHGPKFKAKVALAAMRRLAGSLPEELNPVDFRLDEQFRPVIPPGVGAGARRGVLDLARIAAATE